MAPRKPAFKPMSRRLYFFPALLPLVEFVPWILALLAAAAGAAGLTDFLKKHRRLVMALASILLIACAVTYVQLRGGIDMMRESSKIVAPDAFVTPTTYTLEDEPKRKQPRANKFSFAWSQHVKRQILSSPVIAGDALIYGMFKGGIESLDLKTVSPAWTLQTPNPVFALTIGPDGTIYACEGLHETRVASLYALSADGRTIWQRQFSGHLEENVAFSPDGTSLYVSTGPSGLWALKAKDGHILWHAPIGHIDAKPLEHLGRIYVPAQNEKTKVTTFYALDAQTGDVAWSLEQKGQPWGSPQLSAQGDVILTTTGQGQIGIMREDDAGWAQAVSKDGVLLWEVPLPNMPLQPSMFLPQQDIIVHSDKSGAIIALNARDGSVAWQAFADGELHAPASLVDDGRLIAAVTYDGTFTIWNATDGRRLTRWTIGKYGTSSPVSQGDTIYVTTAWNIYAFTGLKNLR